MPYSANLTPSFFNVFEPLGVLLCVIQNSLHHKPEEVCDAELMTHLKMCIGEEDVEKL
jgi:hypothetical protein